MRLFLSLPNAPVPACLSLSFSVQEHCKCGGTDGSSLAELVPSVNGVQQLYPPAMNIRPERGMEWPAPDINRGINALWFNLFHLFLWGLDFAPLCLSHNTA
ncbi:hypothetical protein QQF64_028671 [Cirrhinus molitorella]|uniref:Uncharacterized protein n=1 Tax=Cirrhinus molitorella TaxID=172907 RepID=A0ABR3N7A0_9TELE